MDEGRLRHVVPLLVAEVRKPGLREFLESSYRAPAIRPTGPRSGSSEKTLRSAAGAERAELFVLLRPGLVAVAADAKALLALDARREPAAPASTARPSASASARPTATASGSCSRPTSSASTAAIAEHDGRRDPQQREALRALGPRRLRYLIFERKEVADRAQTQAVLAFGGARAGHRLLAGRARRRWARSTSSRRTPRAAAAFVFKSPALVFDDVLACSRPPAPSAREELAELESKLDLRLREDLAATLGGEFAMALDGPLLPTPAWKLVVEVYDPARLQASLRAPGRRAPTTRRRAPGGPACAWKPSRWAARRIYSLRGDGLPFELHYAFAGRLPGGRAPAARS